MLAWVMAAGLAWGCPFCNPEAGKTMVEEVREARVVVYCSVKGNDLANQTSDVRVEDLIKGDKKDFPRGKTITIRKYLDKDLLKDKRVLLFCNFYKGRVDAYRGLVADDNGVLPQYVRGAWERRDKPLSERLKFCFEYLDSKDVEASSDAYREFARADYADYKDMADKLPAERILGWLKSKDGLHATRYGLYASMLGHCGNKEHAKKVREILDRPERRSTGADGLLAAYVMLDPKEGFAYVRGILGRPKEDFTYRYAALRAVRFLHDYQQKRVKDEKLDVVGAVCQLLTHDDISDMAIEDLRKWKCWDMADKVLAVTKRDGFDDSTVIKRAVLRYCLQAEGVEKAKQYVKACRKDDEEGVKDAEELLELEKPTETPAVKTTPKK